MTCNGNLVVVAVDKFYHDNDEFERCFCEDKEEHQHSTESADHKEEEIRKTSIKWADWAGGQQLQQVKQDTPWPEETHDVEEDEEEDSHQNNGFCNGANEDECQTVPLLTLTQVKFEPSKSCISGCLINNDNQIEQLIEEVDESSLPDTIEAHLELIREREAKMKMKEEALDQDNPFRPEGELSKEADAIVVAIKEGHQAITPPLAHSPAPPPLSPSSTKDSYDPQLAIDSPDGGVDRALTQEYQTSPTAGAKESAEVKVERGVIVTSKTADVEHVVIPEKTTSCCPCTIL